MKSNSDPFLVSRLSFFLSTRPQNQPNDKAGGPSSTHWAAGQSRKKGWSPEMAPWREVGSAPCQTKTKRRCVGSCTKKPIGKKPKSNVLKKNGCFSAIFLFGEVQVEICYSLVGLSNLSSSIQFRASWSVICVAQWFGVNFCSATSFIESGRPVEKRSPKILMNMYSNLSKQTPEASPMLKWLVLLKAKCDKSQIQKLI